MTDKIKPDYKTCKYYKKKACISCDRDVHDCQQGMILKSPAELREEGRMEERERIHHAVSRKQRWAIPVKGKG